MVVENPSRERRPFFRLATSLAIPKYGAREVEFKQIHFHSTTHTQQHNQTDKMPQLTKLAHQFVWIVETKKCGRRVTFTVEKAVAEFLGVRWLPAVVDTSINTFYQRLYRLMGQVLNADADHLVLTVSNGGKKTTQDCDFEIVDGHKMFMIHVPLRRAKSSMTEITLDLVDASGNPIERVLHNVVKQMTKPGAEDSTNRFSRLGLEPIPEAEWPAWIPKLLNTQTAQQADVQPTTIQYNHEEESEEEVRSPKRSRREGPEWSLSDSFIGVPAENLTALNVVPLQSVPQSTGFHFLLNTNMDAISAMDMQSVDQFGTEVEVAQTETQYLEGTPFPVQQELNRLNLEENLADGSLFLQAFTPEEIFQFEQQVFNLPVEFNLEVPY